MKKRIRISRENIRKIAKVFDCTETSVYNALCFQSEKSEQQRKIRYIALKEYNGVILED
ncbi:MAG: hypothetical protein IJ759_07855 [Bacteroidales bacterium]|nr:hypothetical protein [Bacteroidales bacterium]MBR1775418.1 hypothetical protein [Bacteroidales bacterium]